MFSYVRNLVVKKVKGWKEKFLFQAGREFMIKGVLQAILIFAMSVLVIEAINS